MKVKKLREKGRERGRKGGREEKRMRKGRCTLRPRKKEQWW